MRLLVIEDNPVLVRSLAASLREENFAVDTAEDGDDGLGKALANEYDAIVLDVMLPKRDGWGVLAGLRETKRTPVLMLTARDAVPDRIRGLDQGADDYLTKPFHLEELMARLRALIRRTSGQAQAAVAIGDLTVDTAGRTVRLGTDEIPLTAREYSLLEYLVLHRGETVSRTVLYEHLFDETEDSLSNLLDVHVSNLRRKLGRDLITTRRGLGYCIE